MRGSKREIERGKGIDGWGKGKEDYGEQHGADGQPSHHLGLLSLSLLQWTPVGL